MPLMLLGLFLFTTCLLLQGHVVWSSLVLADSSSNPSLPRKRWHLTLPAGAIALALLHATGLFSTSFILAEGQMVCFLVASFSVLLLHAAGAASLQPSPALLQVHAHAAGCSCDSTGSCQKRCTDTDHAIGRAVAPSARETPAGQPLKTGLSYGAHCQCKNILKVELDGKTFQQVQGCSLVILWGAGLLLCNALMGSMGLVTRTGHDAMHKAAAAVPELEQVLQANTDMTHNRQLSNATAEPRIHVIASLQWLSAAMGKTQELSAPAVSAIMFPLVLLGSSGSLATLGKQQHAGASLRMLALQSVWFSYSVLALYWILAQAELTEKSVASFLRPIIAALMARRYVRQVLDAVTAPVPQRMLMQPVFLHQPLAAFLPHVVLLSSAVALISLFFARMRGHVQHTGTHRHAGGMPEAYLLIAVLAAPILLVSGPARAVIYALGLLQSTCAVQMFQWFHRLETSASHSTALLSRYWYSWLGVAAGSLWALLSMQLFFCTGHFCEFAGLQYAAGEQCL